MPIPQLQIFQCPACGANLSCDGGSETTLTCQFCGGLVVAPEELRGKAASASPPKTQAVVFASARPDSAAPAHTARRAAQATGCGGLGCVGLFVLSIVGFGATMAYLPIRMSGSYQQAVDAVRTNPAAIAALGEPIEVSWWLPAMGQIRCSGGGCSANYDIYIHGSRKSGHINVWSSSHGWTFFSQGTWTLRADVYVEKGPIIDIKPPPPPSLTLSALQVDATQGASSRSTQQAEATHNAITTATEMARRGATATAVARLAQTATAGVSERATAQAVNAAQLVWPVLMSDTFADNQLGWPVGNERGTIDITTTISGKRYVWDVAPLNVSYGNTFPLKTKPVTDFAASVNIKFVRGAKDGWSAYGLVFRHSAQEYGFFGIAPDGHFWVDGEFGSSNQPGYGDQSDAIHAQLGQINKLTVWALGSVLVFLINDRVVSQLSLDLPAGDVGLGVDFGSSDAEPARVEFTEFEVRAPK